MNYGEELAYWYLRLNGFFPLKDFVLHAGNTLEYTSDCDLLAVRPPHVFEEIGGQAADWDPKISHLFADGCTVGMVCEVKTGRYQLDELFQRANLLYAVRRLGLAEDSETATEKLLDGRSFQPSAATYVSRNCSWRALFVITRRFSASASSKSARLARMRRYRESKFRDRHFFPSDLIQDLIDRVEKGINCRSRPIRTLSSAIYSRRSAALRPTCTRVPGVRRCRWEHRIRKR